MAAILLAAGSKGKRYTLPNSRIMIHQPLGGIEGQASDIQIHATEIIKIKQKLNEILSALTQQPIENIEKDSDRNFFLSSSEAVAYGLVDEVLEKHIKS